MRGNLTWRAIARRRLTVFCLLIFSQWSTAATNANLRLEEAIDRTLAHNPALVSFGYHREAKQGRLTQSQVRPAPELGFQVENVLGSGIYDGMDGAEATLSLAWVLERDKREHRIEVARADVSALEAQAAIGRLDAVALTASLFLDILEFQSQSRAHLLKYPNP